MDTNVLVAGLRSRQGSAFRLLSLVGTGQFDIHLSVPLVFEYEDVLLRELPHLQVTQEVVEALIDFHCAVAMHHPIFFLWRPFLRDPKDDMVLELAVKAGCEFIITYNARDFAGVEQFGLRTIDPGAFL
jgi:putative PIN family toxin of toxin-antitoxin system